MRHTGFHVFAFVGLLVGFSAGTAHAAPLLAPFVIGPGDSRITFDEVALVNGQVVTNQFAAFGVTFSPNVFEDTGSPRPTTGFSGQSLANFTSGTNAVTPFEIRFTNDVSRAGAFFEFDIGNAVTFEALLDGSLVETFLFTEPSCCTTGTFIGFQGTVFDTMRVGIAGSTLGIFDDLRFTTFESAQAVPEPTSLLLFGTGAAGLIAKARRRRKQQVQ